MVKITGAKAKPATVKRKVAPAQDATVAKAERGDDAGTPEAKSKVADKRQAAEDQFAAADAAGSPEFQVARAAGVGF